jgi:hypothetical protein
MAGVDHDRGKRDADIIGKWDVIISGGREVRGGGGARPSRSTSSTPLHGMPGAGLLRSKGAVEVEDNGVNGVDMSVCRGCRFMHVLNDHVLVKVCKTAGDQSGGSWKRIDEGRTEVTREPNLPEVVVAKVLQYFGKTLVRKRAGRECGSETSSSRVHSSRRGVSSFCTRNRDS